MDKSHSDQQGRCRNYQFRLFNIKTLLFSGLLAMALTILSASNVLACMYSILLDTYMSKSAYGIDEMPVFNAEIDYCPMMDGSSSVYTEWTAPSGNVYTQSCNADDWVNCSTSLDDWQSIRETGTWSIRSSIGPGWRENSFIVYTYRP